jgi:hypothetical protein
VFGICTINSVYLFYLHHMNMYRNAKQEMYFSAPLVSG